MQKYSLHLKRCYEGVKSVTSIFTPIVGRKQQEKFKRGVFHEATKYHVELIIMWSCYIVPARHRRQ